MEMMATTYQALQALAAVISSVLAGTALLYSIFAYTRNLKISHYNELDKSYQVLLNIAFQNPFIIKPETITSKEQQDKYDIYAFMMWNFLESIYDKCMKDNALKATWEPIICVEGNLHHKWFMRDDNKPKFKAIFCEYVENLLGGKAAA